MENYHFIGIGGIGMSGLARILLSRGVKVSGSDIASSYVTDGLLKAGAKVCIGHAATNLPDTATIIFNTDIPLDNPEYHKAQQLKLPILHRSDLLALLMKPYKMLAVAGTHGKTTTSSLLTSTLIKAGISPSFAVGGILQELQTNARHGEGDFFIAEADESDGTFNKYLPFGAIITNIDFDHMNFFQSEENLIAAFKTFTDKVISKKHLLWCGEDSRLKALSLPGIQYGFHDKCDLQLIRYRQEGWRLFLDIRFHEKIYREIEVALIGNHNVLNASAVFGLALLLDVPEEAIRQGLRSFQGVKRRCELKGNIANIQLLDDYAHHPTEIKTTLEGIRKAIGNKRLIAIFQPHRYSRTKDCLGTFKGCFNAADKLIMTEIYSAGEAPIPQVTHQAILHEIAEDKVDCQFMLRKEVAQRVARELSSDDVVVSLGAGDITKLCAEIMISLQAIF